MNRMIYDIQMKSLRAAVAHLRVIDLEELGEHSLTFGTDDDRALIAAVARCLIGLPQRRR